MKQRFIWTSMILLRMQLAISPIIVRETRGYLNALESGQPPVVVQDDG